MIFKYKKFVPKLVLARLGYERSSAKLWKVKNRGITRRKKQWSDIIKGFKLFRDSQRLLWILQQGRVQRAFLGSLKRGDSLVFQAYDPCRVDLANNTRWVLNFKTFPAWRGALNNQHIFTRDSGFPQHRSHAPHRIKLHTLSTYSFYKILICIWVSTFSAGRNYSF